MKIFLGSLVIFFSTLLAAGLVALGQPGDMGLPLPQPAPQDSAKAQARPERSSGWDQLLASLGFQR